LPDSLNLSATDTILPLVPMFHVNAWGLPYAAAATGCRLVFPGAQLDGASLFELIEQEGVTMAAGVPTVWQGLLAHVRQNRLRFSTLDRVVVGGAACSRGMFEAFRNDLGIDVIHAWGMTETSPLGTVSMPKAKHASLDDASLVSLGLKQGRPPFGVDLRIVDDDGTDLPWDGAKAGHLQVKGPWTVREYFGSSHALPLDSGWFPTGDVGTLDADGYLQITDRSKDVIKSGGEWISSIELENIAMSHHAVARAACIGVPHPRWNERPIVLVVRRPEAEITREELLALYAQSVSKWQIPDDVIFVDDIPLGATGKIVKYGLREAWKHHLFPAE
jgi:acyl-CoA synthetase (AMP-forming)/AMP-acid ligase II